MLSRGNWESHFRNTWLVQAKIVMCLSKGFATWFCQQQECEKTPKSIKMLELPWFHSTAAENIELTCTRCLTMNKYWWLQPESTALFL